MLDMTMRRAQKQIFTLKWYISTITNRVTRERWGYTGRMAITERRKIGNLGESVACTFLQRKGFTIKERNYLKPWGEIDIVAERDNTVHFVEVKSVTREAPGWKNDAVTRERGQYQPEEHVTASKLRKVARTAELYMHEMKDKRDYQIDVIAVLLDPVAQKAKCRHYEQVQ